MAACNQTDIPVLNIQEDPCIQGSLVTSCIFYGLAIDYLGAQNSSSFFDVIGLIVAKLEAGNIDATNLEEDNRAQSLLIEELQEAISISLVTLSEVQLLLDDCCPEPTTTTSTTTIAPTTTTSTTTIAPTTTTTSTTTPVVSYNFTVSASSTSDPVYRCENPYTSGQQTLWAATSIPGDVQKFYTDSNLTNPYIGNVNDYYAYMIGWPSGILYKGQMGSDGTIFNKSTCEATTTTTTVGPTQMFDVYLIQSNSVNNDLDLFSSLANVTRVYLPGGQIFGQVGAQLFLDEELTLSLNFPGNVRMWIQPTGSNEVYDYYSTFLGSTTYEHFNSNVRSVSWIYSNSGLNGVAYRSSDSRVYGLNIPRVVYYNVNEGYQIGTQMYYDYALSMPINENNQLHVANGLYSTPLTTEQENQNIYYIAPATGIITSISGIVKDYAWAYLVGGSPKVSNTGYCDEFYGNGVAVPPGVQTNQVSIGQTVYQGYNQNTGQYDTLDPYWTYFEYNNQAYTVLNGTIQSTYTCATTTTSTTTIAPTTTTTTTSTTTAAPTTTTTSTTTSAPTTTTTTVAVPGSYVFGTTGSEPFGIVVDTAGNIYTSNAVGNNVTKITPSGASTILGTTGQKPLGITIDTAGNVYTANYDQSNVTKITPSGVSTILGTTGSSPVGIVIDLLGNIYTANAVGNNVTKITPSGVSTILGTTGANPRGIAIDADGNIYTANYASANITKITPSGVSTNFPTNGGQAQGITVDSAGNIYVANTGTNNVSKITPGGVTTILGTTDTAPQWIAVDTSGNVYTSNANVNNVTKITPSGVSTILGTTGTFPQGITTDTAGNVYTANRLSNNVTKIVQAPSIFNNYEFNGYVRAVENSSNNSIYVGGDFTEYGTSYVNRIIKLNEGGTQDTSFNPGSGFNGVVWEILEQPDKKILVVGEFTSYNTTPARGIIRLNPDGSRDTSFNYGTGFTGLTGSTTNIARQSDGKLIVASQSTHYNGTPIKTIVRINPDGTLDNTFNLIVVPTAISQSIVPDEIVVDSDDKFFVCWNIATGNDMTINGDITNRSIHKFNADGTTDTSFSVAPNASEPIRVFKLIIKPDGKILAAGQYRVKQYNSDGTVDNSFNIATLEIGIAMEIDSSNRILVGGLFSSVNGISGYKGIVRLNQDGTIDNTFVQGSGFDMPGIILTMEKTLDNKLYLGGNFSSYNGLTCYKLARFDSNGTINTINA